MSPAAEQVLIQETLWEIIHFMCHNRFTFVLLVPKVQLGTCDLSEGSALPANASRAFLMSSALRMPLIAISTVEKRGEMKKDKERERETETDKQEKDREGTRLKTRSLESRARTQRHSRVTLVTL